MSTPRLDLSGLNEQEREEVVEAYDDFLASLAEEFSLREEEMTD